MRQICFWTFVLVLVPFFVFTQEESIGKISEDELVYEVNVTADRLEEPLKEKNDSVTIITREEIERQQWRYVTEALREVPSLTVTRSGSAGKTTSLFLRGAGSAQVLVLIDGIQISDPYFGGVAIEAISTDNVERIEIVRGPQSPLYGSDSIGGVINIISRQGTRGTNVHAGVEAGSFSSFRETAGINGSGGKALYTLDFSRDDSEGQFENDDFRQNTISGTTSFRFNDRTNLAVIGRYHDAESGIPFNYFLTPSLQRRQETEVGVLGSTFRHSFSNRHESAFKFSFSHLDSLFRDPEDQFAPFSHHLSKIFQLGYQHDFQLNEQNTFTAGYDFENQTIDASDATGPVPDLDAFDSVIHAVFAQNKFENDRWSVTAGIRVDHHDTFGNSINPRVVGGFFVTPQWKIRASFGTGFRAPSAGDLAFPFYGNPDLEPEKSRSVEAGLDHWVTPNALISFIYFHNDYEDLITFDPLTFIAQNIAKATAQGIEITGNVRSGHWSLVGSFTYLDSEDEIEKHRLFRRPEFLGSVRVGYENNRWGAGVRFAHTGDRLETDFNVFPPQNVLNSAYQKADLAVHYNVNSWLKLTGRIENLFDEDYEEVLTYKGPGLAAYGGFQIRL